jgi:hypothetical protein
MHDRSGSEAWFLLQGSTPGTKEEAMGAAVFPRCFLRGQRGALRRSGDLSVIYWLLQKEIMEDWILSGGELFLLNLQGFI